MLTFNRHYFALAVLIFATEVAIALFVRDAFVRPWLGDVLVVILMYCAVRSLFDLPVKVVTLFVLAVSFAVEFLQCINIVERVGLENSKLARVVIGTAFAWTDLIAYTLGAAIVVVSEYRSLFRGR